MGKCYSVLLVSCFIGVLGTSCKKHNDVDPFSGPPGSKNGVVETYPPVLTEVNTAIDANTGGYYIVKPAYYNLTTTTYPLIIFIPGGGQYGNGNTSELPLLLNDGMAKLAGAKQFPPNFNVNGNNYSFLILTPQFTGYPDDATVNDVLAFAKKNFRVDTSRIYMSGLSIGGNVISTFAADYYSQIAAIVPVSGEDYSYDACQSIAQHNMPVWDFHNLNDPSVPVQESNDFIARINSYSPVTPPRQTIFPVYGHDAWTQALNPSYKENNMNVYEWMLQYSR